MAKDVYNQSKLDLDQSTVQDKVLSGKKSVPDKITEQLSRVDLFHLGFKSLFSAAGAYWALYMGPENTDKITSSPFASAVMLIFNFVVFFIILN